MVCRNSCGDSCAWFASNLFLWFLCRTRIFSLRYIVFFFMLLIFQLSLFSLVAVSFFLVVGVPIAFASPVRWAQNKRLVLSGTRLWFLLVVLVGILNSFVVLFFYLSCKQYFVLLFFVYFLVCICIACFLYFRFFLYCFFFCFFQFIFLF